MTRGAHVLIELTGTEIAGYKILRRLDVSGAGNRWLAERPGKRERFVMRFYGIEQEMYGAARLIARLKSLPLHPHPQLLMPIEFGQHNGELFAVFAELAGDTLQQRLLHARRNKQPIPVEDSVRYVRQIAQALAVWHRGTGEIHGFVRPENIFIEEARGAILLHLETALPIEQRLNVVGRSYSIGTPEYLSPEAVRGLKCTAASDVFSLGAILYEAVTNIKPFDGESLIDVMQKILTSGTITPPRQHTPQLSEELNAIILRALATDPAERFSSTAELAQALGGEDAPPLALSTSEGRATDKPSHLDGAHAAPVAGVHVDRCSMQWSALTPVKRQDGLEARHCVQCNQQVIRAEDGVVLRLLAGHACTYFDPQEVAPSKDSAERAHSLVERMKLWLRSR